MFALQCQGITRRFGPVPVVDRLDLDVPRQAVYGFLGPNGAGKTTTIRLMLGLIRPDSGSVLVFGKPFSRAALARIGSLVESPSLYPHLSGFENLEVTQRLLGGKSSAIDRVLEIVRLKQDAHRLVREYSLGMRQRLGLALALLHSPDLLILDEPTNGLDPAGIHEMRDLLRKMPQEHGVTVFLSSHLLSEVEQLADSVGIVHRGRMVYQGPLDGLRDGQDARLRIVVRGRADLAAALLPLETTRDGCLFIVRGVSDPAAINRRLVEAGVDVVHLSEERESLERIFLSLTGGAQQ